jgi:hypothetical protein
MINCTNCGLAESCNETYYPHYDLILCWRPMGVLLVTQEIEIHEIL